MYVPVEDAEWAEDEPASLKALQEALERRDATLDGFQHELAIALQQGFLSENRTGVHEALGSKLVAEEAAHGGEHGCDAHGQEPCTDHIQQVSEEPVSLQSLVTSHPISSTAHNYQQLLQAPSVSGTASVGSADVPEFSDHAPSRSPQPPLNGTPLSQLQHPGSYESIVAERQAVLQEYRQQEAVRHAAAEKTRHCREQQAQKEQEEAQVSWAA